MAALGYAQTSAGTHPSVRGRTRIGVPLRTAVRSAVRDSSIPWLFTLSLADGCGAEAPSREASHVAATKWLEGIAEKEAAVDVQPDDVANPRMAPQSAHQDGYIRFCGHALHLECYDSYFAGRDKAVRCIGLAVGHTWCCSPQWLWDARAAAQLSLPSTPPPHTHTHHNHHPAHAHPTLDCGGEHTRTPAYFDH